MQIQVKYIGHSGFAMEFGQHYLLFDYFHGEFPGAEINQYKYPAAFASHSHSDHFNKKIFNLARSNPAFRFFLSNDIAAQHPNARYMKPGDTHREIDIEVYAFGSTDIGVSFAVMCEGLTIFHAGDLNCWTWKDESTQDEIKEAYDMFGAELDKISAEFKSFDIAFFPIDPRMKTDYAEGAEIFLSRFQAAHFFPMHFGVRQYAAKNFQKKYKGDTIVYAPDVMGQKFTLNI